MMYLFVAFSHVNSMDIFNSRPTVFNKFNVVSKVTYPTRKLQCVEAYCGLWEVVHR